MADGMSLRSTAWILSGLSVWALSLADFVSQRGKHIESLTDEDTVELGLFIAGACALMWAAPLSQLAGARLKKNEGFQLIQFFSGGLPSILIQGFAWSCYATAVFACVMALLNPSVNLRGLKTALGLLGLCAQALVNVSVDLFEPDLADALPDASTDASAAVGTPLKVSTPAPKEKVTFLKLVVASLSFTLSGMALAITLLADVGIFAEENKPTVWNVAMGFFTTSVVSMSLTYYAQKKSFADDEREDEVITVAQVFSFLMYCSAVWIYWRLHATPAYASLKGTTVALGIVGIFSSMLSLYAMLWDGYSQSVPPSPRPRSRSHPPLAVNTSSIVYRLSVALLIVSVASYYYNSPLALLFSFIGAPMAHVGAWLVYRLDDGFRLAGALQGGAVFSIFQGVGWMAYAIAVLGSLVFAHASEVDLASWGNPTWADADEFLHPIALIAHLSLLWSKQVFKRVFWLNEDNQLSESRRRLSFNDSTEAETMTTATENDHDQFNLDDDEHHPPAKDESQSGDLGLTKDARQTHRMRLAAETKEAEQRHKSTRNQQWRRAGHRLALGFIAFSVLLQLGIPDHPSVSIMSSMVSIVLLTLNTPAPFSGSPPAVVQQALGWTLFVTSLAAQSVLFFNYKIWKEYDLIACLVRAFGLWILVQGVHHYHQHHHKASSDRDVPESPSVFSPRRRKMTEEEAGLDLRELDELILKAKRPAVKEILGGVRQKLLSGVRIKRYSGVLLGIGCILLAHATLFLGAFVDKNRSSGKSWMNSLFTMEIALGFVSALFIHAVLGRLLWAPFYRFYQPFRGGVQHVVLQSMGWPLIIISAIAQLVAMNYGISKIELDGLLTGIALTSYSGQIVLLASLAKFEEKAQHLGFAFDLEGKELGWLFAVGALVLFLGVDVAIVRFGLQDTTLVAPVIVCAWVAVALSVPLAYGLESRYDESLKRKSRFGILRVAALAIWTFSLFLALFLVGRAANLTTATQWFLPSKTGFASVIAQGMMTISSEPGKTVFLVQQVAFLATTLGFLWVILPFIRVLLDGPMWYYAYFFKFWKHSLSPDGKHPLENAMIHRNIRYGEDLMDVMVPLTVSHHSIDSNKDGSTDAKNTLIDQEELHPPVVYMHGGGHLFVKRELLSHSMTPLCRAGTVVYTVEYPLSPECCFPKAIVCVLQALKWIREQHCRSGTCLAGGKPKVCADCQHTTPPPPLKDYPCGCCPHKRGASAVQLLGDSAGGNLAAMVTALLCNDHLLKAIAPHSCYSDFLEWKLPRVQRLGVIYGLLGRNVVEEMEEQAGENIQLRSTTSWLDWIKRRSGEVAVSFILNQYTGTTKALDGKVVLNDLEAHLVDFAPETLMLCGTADPLVVTNRQALKMIREQTGRECTLIEYEGSFHSFHGMPVQWTLGRWEKDAYPATRELVKFFTGGAFTMPEVDFKGLPKDYSPMVVFPLTVIGVAIVLRGLWFFVGIGLSAVSQALEVY